MIALEDFADDAGALAVLLRGVEPHLAHRVQDAALHGLEAVAHVGQRARRDDRHGIGEVALPHLVFDGDRGHPRVVVHWCFLRLGSWEFGLGSRGELVGGGRATTALGEHRVLSQRGEVGVVPRVELGQMRRRPGRRVGPRTSAEFAVTWRLGRAA